MGASPVVARDFYSQAQARSNLSDIVRELRAILRCRTVKCALQLKLWSAGVSGHSGASLAAAAMSWPYTCTLKHLTKKDDLPV